MKKSIITKTTALLLSAALTSAIPAFQAFAVEGDGGYPADKIAASEIQPKMTVTKEMLSLDEAKENPTRTVTLYVEEPDQTGGFYAGTGFFVLYDNRLTISTDQFGRSDIKTGNAIKKCNFASKDYHDPTSDRYGFFVATAAEADYATTGEYISFDVTLPDDVQPGDAFPIDIVYNDFATFCKANSGTEQSKLMQAYLFTQGIFTPDHPVTADDDTNGIIVDTSYDGYIAVFDDSPLSDVTYGDVNNDSEVNLNDGVAVLQYIALSAKSPLEGDALEAADACDNGTSGINGNDALAIMMVDAGLLTPDKLPVTSDTLK